MSLLVEVSLSHLFDQTVSNQPIKLRRSNTVTIDEDMKYIFLPPKTLVIRTLAYGNEVYNMTIVLNDVNKTTRGKLNIETLSGPIKITSINPKIGNAQVFCSCTDFAFAYNRQNHNVDALSELDIDISGKKAINVNNLRPPYVKITDRQPRTDYSSNPGLCKHLIKFVKQLKANGIFGRYAI